MRNLAKAAFLAAIVLFPALTHAQSLTGVVRDPSGAVLPGVTVEAASPALIEKVRSVVSDGAGQYPSGEPGSRHLLGHLYATWLQRRQARRC